ncbi:hypothetical protein [Parashewanella tropica]|uniref:hypothetical protein n=1 Tax=Parashewanella tropica TaxID=2547970 RepID=UPI00105A49AB|nr:hypothetical protein [Parashewanella tropica]
MKKLTKILTAVALLSSTQAVVAGQNPFPTRDIGKIVDCKTQECQPLEQIYVNLKYKYYDYQKFSRPQLSMEFAGNNASIGPYKLQFDEQYWLRKDRKFIFEPGPYQNLNYYPFPITGTFERGSYTYDRNNNIPVEKFLQADKIRQQIINYFMTSPSFSNYRDLAMVRSIQKKQDVSVRVDLRQVPVKNNPSKNYWAGYVQVWNNTTNQDVTDVGAWSLTFDQGIVNGIWHMRADIPLTGGYHGNTLYGRDDSQGAQRFAEFIEKKTDFGEFLNFMHSKS